jgi:hypothetical protein
MHTKFYEKLNYVSGFRENRQILADEVLLNPSLLIELVPLCFQISDTNSHKACWILELFCYEKLEELSPYLDFFCSNIKNLTADSAIRPLAKVCQLLTISHFKKKEIQLTEPQLHQITETCFDWLITDTKVASKCYAIRTLYLLGNQFDWIHQELKIILEKDYTNHSAAYKAVSKEILKKIK